jgi:hypothetical protein
MVIMADLKVRLYDQMCTAGLELAPKAAIALPSARMRDRTPPTCLWFVIGIAWRWTSLRSVGGSRA